jgi:CRISPR/Cas system-associated protein Cas5 (RAMP superfamily)
MFEYLITIPSLLEEKEKEVEGEKLNWSMGIAKYNFNLGLQVKDELELILRYDNDKLFEFKGEVIKVSKVIESNKNKPGNDIFRIEAHIEIGDKEDFVKVREILKNLNSPKSPSITLIDMS